MTPHDAICHVGRSSLRVGFGCVSVSALSLGVGVEVEEVEEEVEEEEEEEEGLDRVSRERRPS